MWLVAPAEVPIPPHLIPRVCLRRLLIQRVLQVMIRLQWRFASFTPYREPILMASAVCTYLYRIRHISCLREWKQLPQGNCSNPKSVYLKLYLYRDTLYLLVIFKRTFSKTITTLPALCTSLTKVYMRGFSPIRESLTWLIPAFILKYLTFMVPPGLQIPALHYC